MVSEAPPFWWTKTGWQAICLYPLSFVYGRISGAILQHRRRHPLSVPVICVGNFTVVDPHHHRSTAVGDEPLLLAREALTVISRRRVAGAEKLVAEGADLIIMDDGFQSARLHVDYALIVIDSMRGIGNGWVVPSGPVRAPIPQPWQSSRRSSAPALRPCRASRH